VMHGLWLIAMAVLVFSALTGWFGKKAWPHSGNDSRR
jgi:hypothetical protein